MFWFNKSIKFKELHFGVDMHSHLLPGVDDGFHKADHSLEAAERLKALGFDALILTPHINPEFYPENTTEAIRGKYAALKSDFESRGVKTTISGEHMVYDTFETYLETNKENLLLMPDGKMLIEMSYAYPAGNIREIIFYLNLNGIKPILAHPERYLFYSIDLHDITALKSLDCRMQLNLLSLSGYYGRTIKAKAEAILEHGLYAYAGTDLHGLSQLPSLENLTIPRKYLPAIEKIIEGNATLCYRN